MVHLIIYSLRPQVVVKLHFYHHFIFLPTSMILDLFMVRTILTHSLINQFLNILTVLIFLTKLIGIFCKWEGQRSYMVLEFLIQVLLPLIMPISNPQYDLVAPSLRHLIVLEQSFLQILYFLLWQLDWNNQIYLA